MEIPAVRRVEIMNRYVEVLNSDREDIASAAVPILFDNSGWKQRLPAKRWLRRRSLEPLLRKY
jgi:hypothetical protein